MQSSLWQVQYGLMTEIHSYQPQITKEKNTNNSRDSAPHHMDVNNTTLNHKTRFVKFSLKTPYNLQSDQGQQDETTGRPCSNMWKCNIILGNTVHFRSYFNRGRCHHTTTITETDSVTLLYTKWTVARQYHTLGVVQLSGYYKVRAGVRSKGQSQRSMRPRRKKSQIHQFSASL